MRNEEWVGLATGGPDLSPGRRRPRKTRALLYSRKADFKQRSLWHAEDDRKEMPYQTVFVLLGGKAEDKKEKGLSSTRDDSSPLL